MKLTSEPWLCLDTVESTQEVAKKEITTGLAAVIFAHEQTHGRGRFDRIWLSPSGESLALSLVFHEYADHPAPWLIGMGVAAAVAGALHCQLQWPNDLLLDGKKLGGVLTEIVLDPMGRRIPIVGIGVNIRTLSFPTELTDIATSLALHHPDVPAPVEIAKTIVERIQLAPEPEQWESIRGMWMLFDSTPGKTYRLGDGQEALGISVGPRGELICSVDGETQSVLAADALFGT